jgi:hypothetical protein
MADEDRTGFKTTRIPVWVWVLIAAIVAGVIFYVATRPPASPERGDVFANETMADDPFITGEPVLPVEPQPVDPVAPDGQTGTAEPLPPVDPDQHAIGNTQ